MLLQESFSSNLTENSISDGVIKGVRILGRHSKNGRTYSDQAMREAQALYEGAEVNVDHPDRRSSGATERALADGFGELRNTRVVIEGKDASDGVFGDLHYLKSHPMAEQIVERAKRFPDKVGLSHNAEGQVVTKGGKKVVESIRRVISVDVVARPATNSTLFESEEEMSKKTTVREIVARLLPRRAKEVLREQDEAIAGAPVDVSASASPQDEIKAAFRAMVVAAFDDESLDAKATMAKIKDILAAQQKLMAAPAASGESGSESSGSEAATESHRIEALERKLALADAENECRALLESKGVKCNPTRLKALVAVSADLRDELVESWKGLDPSDRTERRRPDASAPLYEQLGNQSEDTGKMPEFKDSASFVRSITR